MGAAKAPAPPNKGTSEMPSDSRNKNRYACTYDEALSFLKELGYEVTNKKVLDEAAVQTHYEIRTQRQPNDALQALEKAIRKKTRGLIDRIPDSTALPLLLWLSHQYELAKIQSREHTEEKPGWLIFEYARTQNGKIKSVPYYNYTPEDVKNQLFECFNTSPGLFISIAPALSRIFKDALRNKSVYNNHLRLKNFILHNFPEKGIRIRQPGTTKDLIQTYLNHYSRQDIPSQKGPLIVTLLSAAKANPEWQPDFFLEKWSALLKYDAAELGITGKNKLFQAATEAFRKPFTNRSDIAMEIDRLTDYEYTDLTIRRKYYRRIKYHIEKHLKKRKNEAVNRSFSVTEEFGRQAKLKPKLKSEENVRLAIEETLERFDEVEKIIAESGLSVANRSTPSGLSSRLTQATLDQIDVLAQRLKGLNGLPARKNRSVALEIAVRFKERADLARRKDTRSSYNRPNDAFTNPMQMRKEVAAWPTPSEEATENQVTDHLPAEKPAATLSNNIFETGQGQNHTTALKPTNPTTSQDNEAEQEASSAPVEAHTADADTHAHQTAPNPLESPQEEPIEKTLPYPYYKTEGGSGRQSGLLTAEKHSDSDAQPSTAKEHRSLPANQPGIQETAVPTPVESNVPPQKANTIPPVGAPEEPQESKVATEAASEEKHPQGSEPPEASEAPRRNAFEQRDPQPASQDGTHSPPHVRSRSDRNDLRPSSWNQLAKLAAQKKQQAKECKAEAIETSEETHSRNRPKATQKPPGDETIPH